MNLCGLKLYLQILLVMVFITAQPLVAVKMKHVFCHYADVVILKKLLKKCYSVHIFV